jgi:hypothetical protein
MFSLLNEIKDNSAKRLALSYSHMALTDDYRTTGVVVASIGSAAFLYVLVAITGYLSFGNSIVGNIVSMCSSPSLSLLDLSLLFSLFQAHTFDQQTAPLLRQRSPKLPLWSSSCSLTRFRSTLVVPLSTLSSNGDQAAIYPHVTTLPPAHYPCSHRHQPTALLVTTLSLNCASLSSRLSL